MEFRTYLENLISAKEKRANEIKSKIENSEDANEIRSLMTAFDGISNELTEARNQLSAFSDTDENTPQTRNVNPIGNLAPVSQIFNTRNVTSSATSTIEERLAFANYVTRGVIPETAETRANANTKTTDVSVAIPENLITTIVEKIESIGMILPLVTHTSYPVGQTIPVDGVKPVASWVAEGATSDKQKKSGLGSIVFGGFKLRCEISMSQEVTVKTIASFENLFVKQISEAMVKAQELKIMSANDGTTGPTGILYNSAESTNPDKNVEIAKLATGHLTYKVLCDAEAEIPEQYENNVKWVMSKKTFMSFISMTDTNGQPIARINYGIGGKPERTLLNREVVLCGDYLPNYSEATATEDVCFAFLFNFEDYVLNTNYDLSVQSKVDWDTEDKLTKAVMSVDGKVIRRDSLVKLIKKYS